MCAVLWIAAYPQHRNAARRTQQPTESRGVLDLAGTKAAVVQQRPEAKDYVDLDAMMGAGVGLPTALAAAKLI